MPKAALALLATLLATTAAAQEVAVPVRSALEPATTGGIEVVDRALAKLATHKRLLVIGAHPDDEDTSLLTLVSRGLGGEAAYLALSRGDGGQNLIGTELGEGLGLIRTQELLAARRVDGAHQYFTRAFDFGYTRSLDETLRRWPREVLLEDVARVIWRFRPQVIVAMFSPQVGGHGQHLASGWAAQEIFPVAGSAERFPQLVVEGWLPWQPTALYRRTWFDPERASFELSLGDVEGLTGRSILQLAMLSRSQHRSQDMGMLQPLGTRTAGLEWVEGGSGPESGQLFADVDTRLEAMAHPLPEGALRRRTEAALRTASETAEAARQALSPAKLGLAVPALAAILDILDEVHESVSRSEEGGARVVADLVREKIEVARAGLAAAAGIGLEAVCDRETVAPGAIANVVASLWNSGKESVEVLDVELTGSGDWHLEPRQLEDETGFGIQEWGFSAGLRTGAAPSMPYYLRSPRRRDLYDWKTVDPVLRGLPYQDPELGVRFRLSIAGREIELMREVVYRARDQALGEVRRPIRAVPVAEVSVAPSTMLWDLTASGGRKVAVTVRSHLETALSGEIVVAEPEGWSAVPGHFEITEPRGEITVEMTIEPVGEVAAGRYRFDFAARLDDREATPGDTSGGERLSLPVLDYPHIRPTPLPVAAALEISAVDLELPDVGLIGYVRGASDRLPELLVQVGLEVELLGEEELARGDLSRFRVIVIGSRAYETDTALIEANSRLLDFVAAGGRLIVQYQQYQFSRGGFAPFALDIARPHGRVTDETAAVELLEPSHPVFNTPNVLNAADWEGWVQERGLYFADTWGEEFEPLLAIADPGMEKQQGGLLVARLGEGVYVYTGLAFFRQLPAGVAGGYRLFFNLLAVQ